MSVGAAMPPIPGPQAGAPPASPQLGQLMNQQGAPANKQTPNDRIFPGESWALRIQQAIAVLNQGLERYADDAKPPEVDMIRAIVHALRMTTKDVDPVIVSARTAASLAQAIAPPLAMQLNQLADRLSAPAIAPAGGGAQPMGAPPLGMPSVGIPPAMGHLAGQPPLGATAGMASPGLPPVPPANVPPGA